MEETGLPPQENPTSVENIPGNTGTKLSSAPLSLKQHQMPLPFIMPQKLGPLPSPGTRPLMDAVRSEQARTISSAPEAYPWTKVRPRTRGDEEGRMIRQNHVLSPSWFDSQRWQRLEGSGVALLPPPLPTYPRSSNSHEIFPIFDSLAPSRARVSSTPPRSLLRSPRRRGEMDSAPDILPRSAAVGAIRYRCVHCSLFFASNGSLTRHQKMHLGRHYRCGCGATYTEMSVLRVSSRSTMPYCATSHYYLKTRLDPFSACRSTKR